MTIGTHAHVITDEAKGYGPPAVVIIASDEDGYDSEVLATYPITDQTQEPIEDNGWEIVGPKTQIDTGYDIYQVAKDHKPERNLDMPANYTANHWY